MKNAWFAYLIAGASLLLITTPASGHHGWAAFESRNQVTLKGTVTDFHFVNPHSVVEFEVKDAKGQVQQWEGEVTSPSHLVPKGWSASTLEPGDHVTITGYPAKNGSHSVRVTRILFSNGRELKLDNGKEDQ
jgi:hypothetical protein